MRSAGRAAAAALAAGLLVLSAGAGEEPGVLENGRFESWTPAGPSAWTSRVGATTGSGPESLVERGPDGGLLLRGDARTRVWRLLAQEVPLEAGSSHRLSHVARAHARLDPGQFDNAYVGVKNGGAWQVDGVLSEEWAPGEVVFRARGSAAEVAVFLSKTGRLEVREVSLEALRPEDSFDVLVRNVGRYYPTFTLRGVDWPAHAARFRERALAAKDERGFVAVVREMLAPLRDLHVLVRGSDGTLQPTHAEAVRLNLDVPSFAKSLRDPRQIGEVAVAGDVDERIGFVAVYSLGAAASLYDEIAREIEARREKDGLILDLRGNVGGDETRAQAIASLFADESRVYAVRRFRSGPGPDDLGPPNEARIGPKGPGTFTKPVVCLVGPGCVSSGEGFAQMMAVLPHVTLVGQPTRGASGNPQPLDLPNGVTVVYSRWVDFLPDGQVLETKGVPPDVVVEHEGPGDPTFDAGVRVLRERLAR